MKNIFIFLLFSAMLIIGSSNLFASDIAPIEQKMLNSYMVDKDARPAIREAYWKRMVSGIDVMRSFLPIDVYPGITLVAIGYDGNKTITYSHVIGLTDIDLYKVKSNMLEQYCQDHQMRLYLITFEGTFEFVYYFVGGLSGVTGRFSVSSSDCDNGI